MIRDGLNSVAKKVPAWPLYILLTIPGVWLFVLAFQNNLGADPLKALEHQLGEWGLQLILVGLLITPLRDWFRINFLKYRRAIGLMAFFYVVAHFMVYLWLDQQWYWNEIWKDIVKRPYITFGMIATILMLPLAVTSNNYSIRKMGAAAWNKMHKLVYVAAAGGVLHYLLLTKVWEFEPIMYALGLFILLTHRVHKTYKSRQKMRASAA